MYGSQEQMAVDEDNGTMEAVIKQLRCPSCKGLMSGPIELCANAHSVCLACRSRGPDCPVCGGQFLGLRNRFAEGLSCHFRKCRNDKCEYAGLLNTMVEHEKACRYRLIKCLMCQDSICLLDMKSHYEKVHSGSVLSTIKNTSLLSTRSTNKFQLLECSGKYFWFWKHKTNKLMYMGVHAAEKYQETYKYCLKLESKDKTRELNLKLPVHDPEEHVDFQGNFSKCRKCAMVTISTAKETLCNVDIIK